MSKQSTCITLDNCTILTMNQKNTCIPNGRIRICGSRIEALGHKDDIQTKGILYDMKGRIVMPGLINTHTHSPSTLFRGLADDMYLREWLTEHMWPAEKNLTSEFAYYGSRLAYLEYLTNGMTTNVDMWYFADSLASAAREAGLRSIIAAGIYSFPTPQSDHSLQDAEDFLSSQQAQHRTSDEDQRIIPCLGPHDVYSTTPELLREAAELSSRYNTMIHMHLSETIKDNEESLQLYQKTPAQVAEAAGIFTRPTLCAHCIHLTDTDMDIFEKNNVSVSYNPVTNMKLCEGILPIAKLRKKGITVSIGVDGAQSNNSLNLRSDAKTGVLIQKYGDNDPRCMDAVSAVRMMTIEGARAIHMEKDIGSLEVGKYADIISIDLDTPATTPLLATNTTNICSHLVYTDTSINDVMVGGEFLLKNKEYQRVNPKEIMLEAQNAADYIINKI